MKSMMSILLVLCMFFKAVLPVSAESYDQSEDLSEEEVLFAAHYILAADSDMNLWPQKMNGYMITPLYSPSGKKIAFYLSFGESYAVIHNSKDNPDIIEMGTGKKEQIEKIINNSDEPVIIYNNPISIYEKNSSVIPFTAEEQTDGESADLYSFYPDLKQKNHILSRAVANTVLYYEKFVKNSGKGQKSLINGDYGFLDTYPSGSALVNNVSNISPNSWLTTYDFNGIATDQCGVTAAYNVLKYYKERDTLTGLLNAATLYQNKLSVYSYIGDGPVYNLIPGLTNYSLAKGYTIHYSTVSGFSGIKSAVNNNHITTLLLENSLNNWHWVIAVGYREYTSGSQYVRIHNGWNTSADTYYRPYVGSYLFTAVQYWF